MLFSDSTRLNRDVRVLAFCLFCVELDELYISYLLEMLDL